MTDEAISRDPGFAEWFKLPPAKQAAAWEKIRPGTFDEIWAEAKAEGLHRRSMENDVTTNKIARENVQARHERRIAWFVQILFAVRIVCAFAALIVTAMFADSLAEKDSGKAVMAFGIGGGSTVALFLGMRAATVPFLRESKSAKDKDDKSKSGEE